MQPDPRTQDEAAPGRLAHLASATLSLPIHFYRRVLSPVLPAACRYEPSCSAYALEALSRHGPIKGLWLTGRRLARCQPWGGHGHDPVPSRPARSLAPPAA